MARAKGIKISEIEDIGNGQLRCTVTVTKSFGNILPGVYDNFVVDATDTEGLGPSVRGVLQPALAAARKAHEDKSPNKPKDDKPKEPRP